VTWPNRITWSRILLIPVFAIAAIEIRRHPDARFVAFGLFALMAFTDLLDGVIARRFKLTSIEGKFIDPIADKLLMTTACVFLALPVWGMPDGQSPLDVEVAIIIIARDAMICLWVVVAFLSGTRRVYEPTRLGQLTTLLQMLALGAMLAGTIWLPFHRRFAVPLSYAAAAATIASGLQYAYLYARTISFHGSDE
jgi:CDP-diacylglycerol--glycerol-3-phosphate 3-phosphatidyltransferase